MSGELPKCACGCGATVGKPTSKYVRGHHIRAQRKANEAERAEKEEVSVEAEAVQEVQPEHDSTTGKVYSANSSAIQKLNALAKKIQRKGAPEIDVKSGKVPIRQKIVIAELQERDAKRGEAGKWHYCPAPQKEMRDYAHRGYEIEIDETGEPIRFEGDIMYRIPKEHEEARLKQTTAIHNKRVGAERKRSNTRGGVEIENKSTDPDGKITAEEITAAL